uniref:Uncharacterized protein n=1 Tax=Psilocybe cubensis TaxID=181762 RepID=A0A8H7Y3S9_PSICU
MQYSQTSRREGGPAIEYSPDSDAAVDQTEKWYKELEGYVNFDDESEYLKVYLSEDATQQKERVHQEPRLPGNSWFASGTLSGDENTSSTPAGPHPFPLLRRPFRYVPAYENVLANTQTPNVGWRGTLHGYLTHLPQFRRIERDGKTGDYWVLDVTKIHGHR